MEFFTDFSVFTLRKKRALTRGRERKGMEEKEIKDSEIKNPWKEKDGFPTPRILPVILSALAFLLSCLQIAQPYGEMLSLVAMGFLFAYAVFMARSPGAVIPVLLAAVVPTIFGFTFSVSAFLLAIVIGTSACAFLLTSLRRPWFFLLLPVGAWGIAWLLTGDPLSSLAALGLIPAALLLAIATKRCEMRTSAIGFTAAGLVAVGGLAILIPLLTAAREAGTDIGIYLQDLFFDAVTMVRDELFALMDADVELQTPELLEQIKLLKEMLTDSYIREILNTVIIPLLPGFLLGLAAILSFLAQLLLTASYKGAGMGAVVMKESLLFVMSVPSAVLYIISFFVFLFAPSGEMLWALTGNVFLMLLPAFLLTGVRSLTFIFLRMKGGRMILLLPILALFCCNFIGGLMVLSLWGANGILLSPLQGWIRRRLDPHDGPRE